MNFNEIINSRRSVRSFQEKKIPKNILKELIKDASKAPSACNRQPWIFYIVDTKEIRDEVSKILRKTLITLKDQIDIKKDETQKLIYEFYNDLGGAQNIIFIYRKKEINEEPWIYPTDIQSISCAAQNLTLSAVNKNLGTCWIGSFKGEEKSISKLLNIKKNEELVTSILIGYPKEDFKPSKKEMKKIDDILNFI